MGVFIIQMISSIELNLQKHGMAICKQCSSELFEIAFINQFFITQFRKQKHQFVIIPSIKTLKTIYVDQDSPPQISQKPFEYCYINAILCWNCKNQVGTFLLSGTEYFKDFIGRNIINLRALDVIASKQTLEELVQQFEKLLEEEPQETEESLHEDLMQLKEEIVSESNRMHHGEVIRGIVDVLGVLHTTILTIEKRGKQVELATSCLQAKIEKILTKKE